jgi:hypothetical protein
MRKYLYAGSVAGGFLLLAASPAQADVIPVPNGVQQGAGLGGLLGPDGSVGLDHPLGGAKVLNVEPGVNTPDLTGAATGLLPKENAMPAARTGLGKPSDRMPASGQIAGSAADQAAGLAGRAIPGVGSVPSLGGGGSPLRGLPIGSLLGGGLLGGGLGGAPLGGGLADGRMPATAPSEESGLITDNLPMLGGLLPISPVRTLPALSGLPAGGTAVPAGEDPTDVGTTDAGSTGADPAQDRPVAKPAADAATAGDARLHEEPVDPKGEAGQRKFSAGRPVDSQYK